MRPQTLASYSPASSFQRSPIPTRHWPPPPALCNGAPAARPCPPSHNPNRRRKAQPLNPATSFAQPDVSHRPSSCHHRQSSCLPCPRAAPPTPPPPTHTHTTHHHPRSEMVQLPKTLPELAGDYRRRNRWIWLLLRPFLVSEILTVSLFPFWGSRFSLNQEDSHTLPYIYNYTGQFYVKNQPQAISNQAYQIRCKQEPAHPSTDRRSPIPTPRTGIRCQPCPAVPPPPIHHHPPLIPIGGGTPTP